MYKILIVEDDINISEMVTDYLSGEGYEVLPVYTGESAISALEQESYDLALIDLMLPGCSGFDVVKSIRKKSVMPVIIITAKDNDIDKTRGLNLGADDYVTKPFYIDELVARVNVQLRNADLLDMAKLHSLKENIAKEIIEQTIDIFSTFRSRAKELEINEESINKIEKKVIRSL